MNVVCPSDELKSSIIVPFWFATGYKNKAILALN